MIIDIPTKEDFYSSADDMVNEAWEKVSNLAHEFYKSSNFISNDGEWNLDGYWEHHRPKLISSLTLILQSVEFRLKGLIVEISPFLLLSSSSKNIPKADQFGIRSFSQFHSIDAQDLIKVYETFSNKQLSSKFRTWFEDIRILRNKFMHTVDKNSEITPELIFKCIVYAHNELNQEDDHWIWHRFKYKSKHSGEGIDFNTDNDIPGEFFEMIQVHYEFLGALNVCSREMANELFNFDINSERFYCVECLDVMGKNEYFDSRHLDYCIETVQKNKRSDNYQCVFCNEEYKEIPDSMWKDEE